MESAKEAGGKVAKFYFNILIDLDSSRNVSMVSSTASI